MLRGSHTESWRKAFFSSALIGETRFCKNKHHLIRWCFRLLPEDWLSDHLPASVDIVADPDEFPPFFRDSHGDLLVYREGYFLLHTAPLMRGFLCDYRKGACMLQHAPRSSSWCQENDGSDHPLRVKVGEESVGR